MFIVYTILALFATFTGALTGMGGGIIMKPVMDLLGDFGSADINILSSITVFAMSLVSCAKKLFGKKRSAPFIQTPASALTLLAIGSVAGGYAGQVLFSLLSSGSDTVKQVQNLIMALLVVIIFFYMLFKDRLPSLKLTALLWYPAVGILLGVISSFLGIGGGPVNVALLTLFFAMDIKTAVFTSLLSVLFTQSSKLITVALTTGYALFDLSVLPFMVAGGIAGALIGGVVSSRLSSRTTRLLFCGVQIVIFTVCLFNLFA